MSSRESEDLITIVVLGNPVVKKRPRIGKMGAYTPVSTKKYERVVAWQSKQAMSGRKPLDTALVADVVIDLPVPKSWSKVKKIKAINGEIMPTTRPDIDNYIKSIFDGMDGIVFVDDARVVKMTVVKRYSAEPKVIVKISNVGGLLL